MARRPLMFLAAFAAAASLSGCVAVAVPIAASAAVFGSSGSKDDGATASARAAAEAPATDAGREQVVDASLAREFDESIRPRDASGTEIPAGPVVGPAFLRGAAPAPVRNTAYDAFRSYVLETLDTPIGTGKRRSALLASPDLQQPRRQSCGSRPAAIVIDLDPGRETFDPLAPSLSNRSLARVVSELRQRDVTIFWTSRLGEGFEESLRATLAETGLDPAGEDRLLLASTLDQRKQTLREDAAKTHCIVAILGDERADFDELFLYLKRPDAAIRLDSMIGAGWFLGEPLTTFETGDR